MTYTPKKKCSKCGKEKLLTNFNKKGEGKTQPWCRECNRIRSRQYYADNREQHLKDVRANTDRYRQRNQEFVCHFLQANACVDCGEDDIRTLEFDHLDDKEESIARAISTPWSLNRLKAEMAKCEVVCANCHRKRTGARGNWYRHQFLSA